MIPISGQWQGYYIYGPEYGESLSCSKVTFELSLTDLGNNNFQGTCLDLDNHITENNLAIIKGFTEQDFISFTKEYCRKIPRSQLKKPELNYYGHYDPANETFSGDWELIWKEHAYPDGDYLEIGTGTWEMKRI